MYAVEQERKTREGADPGGDAVEGDSALATGVRREVLAKFDRSVAVCERLRAPGSDDAALAAWLLQGARHPSDKLPDNVLELSGKADAVARLEARCKALFEEEQGGIP